MDFGSAAKTDAKAWRDIWGCGQGIGNINEVASAADLVAKFRKEYDTAAKRMTGLIG